MWNVIAISPWFFCSQGHLTSLLPLMCHFFKSTSLTSKKRNKCLDKVKSTSRIELVNTFILSLKILWYLWRSCRRIGTTFMVWSRSRWKTEFDKSLQSPYCKSFDTKQFEISFVKKNVKVRAEVTYWISDCFASH